VWNLCVEQESHWRPGRGPVAGLIERCQQLTEARADNPWLAAGSSIVQQQAIRDYHHAMQAFFDGARDKPTWRKAKRRDGFRIVMLKSHHIRRLNRKAGEVWIPKVGWVRFRWSRAVPGGARSYRVTRDRTGRWHIAFAAVPEPIPAPGTGEVVGIDRGVAVSAALSTGEMLTVPGWSKPEQRRFKRLERQLSKSKRCSKRRERIRKGRARLSARETDRRKDRAEKLSTRVALRFDIIRVEELDIMNLTRSAKGTTVSPGQSVAAKSALNDRILRSGWGLLVRRLEDKAPGRVEKVPPAYTSQRCSACGHVDGRSRESQAAFRCTSCGYACNADVNAARNIAAGHAVTARGGDRATGPANREPHLLAS
jgi:transposase